MWAVEKVSILGVRNTNKRHFLLRKRRLGVDSYACLLLELDVEPRKKLQRILKLCEWEVKILLSLSFQESWKFSAHE